jgi:hypothetical protein
VPLQLGEGLLPALLQLDRVRPVDGAGEPHDAVDVVDVVGSEQELDLEVVPLGVLGLGQVAVDGDRILQSPEPLVAAAGEDDERGRGRPPGGFFSILQGTAPLRLDVLARSRVDVDVQVVDLADVRPLRLLRNVAVDLATLK